MRPVVVALILALWPLSVEAQHLGARVQWQPEITDSDPRLHQTVETEIIGCAAVHALSKLSSATGVALAVAPENRTTVGERKITIISKTVPLKALMVQIPEALQECHWDIDTSRGEPVYLLHRNAGVDVERQERSPEKESFEREELLENPPHAKPPRNPSNNPALQTLVVLRSGDCADLAQIQRAISRQTGLTIISDYFGDGFPLAVASAAFGPQPLWLLLDEINYSDSVDPAFIWRMKGQCLIFHRVDWHRLAMRELPEDILVFCREKIREQTYLTFPDLGEVAAVLHERGLTDVQFPSDIRRAGVHGAVITDAWALALCNSLSAAQRVQARGETGLPFSDLTEAQQSYVLGHARNNPEFLPIGEAPMSTVYVFEYTQPLGRRNGQIIEVQLEFPSAADVALFAFPLEQDTER